MSSTQQTSPSEQPMKEPLTTRPEKADLKAERVQEALRKLPGWGLDETGAAIQRTREFGQLTEALAYVGFVGTLATAKRQPVTVAVAGKQVGVTLTGHPVRGRAGGLRKAVFKLAALIG